MRHFDFNTINRMRGWRNALILDTLKTFPGKTPTRIHIRIFRRDENYRKIVYYSYNGVNNNSALKRAHRLYRKLFKVDTRGLYTEFTEYLPGLIIFNGSLFGGTAYKEYGAFYLNFPLVTRALNGVVPDIDVKIVKHHGHSFYVSKQDMPKLGDVDALKSLRIRMSDRLKAIRG